MLFAVKIADIIAKMKDSIFAIEGVCIAPMIQSSFAATEKGKKMMTLENAIKTLDDVIPPHTHRTVDREHMPIALAWEAVKNELENRVPVVRCEDCKHHEDEQPGMVWCPYNIGSWVENDFFCAYGERKADENEPLGT